MTASTPQQSLGRRGEELAAAFLRRRGFRILETGVRSRLGEIDIVADSPADGGEPLIVFVEVKTRRSTVFGTPQEAVDRRKQRRLIRLAEAWLQNNPALSERACRFDVIGIVIDRRGHHRIEHIPDAFRQN